MAPEARCHVCDGRFNPNEVALRAARPRSCSEDPDCAACRPATRMSLVHWGSEDLVLLHPECWCRLLAVVVSASVEVLSGEGDL